MKKNFHSETAFWRNGVVSMRSVQNLSRYSKADRCLVALLPCHDCGRLFEEELHTAKAKIISGAKFFCIRCDVEAEH